jgi:hypothetical protein
LEGGNGAIILTNVRKYSKTYKNCIETCKNYAEIFKSCIETFEKIGRIPLRRRGALRNGIAINHAEILEAVGN